MCITKVLAMILDDRIHAWTEGAGLRADGQAGFRRDHRTLDNIFIMRTLIEQCKSRDIHRTGQKKKLYACFVDFKKAFDTVPRDLLWRALARIGMGPKMMHCIKSMYDTDTARVQTQTGLTDAFCCTIGVKQGCPLSPNLFGLYLDSLQATLQDTPNSDCPVLGDTALPLLLYADDLAILSHSQEGLQRLMDALQAFCHTKRLTVNIEKTKAMVFSKKAISLVLTYQGQQIEQVSEFRYLGLDLHQSKGFTFCASHLLAAARKALFGLKRRCKELHITDPRLQCSLFDTLVRPILSYGCEIWAVEADHKELNQLEGLHIDFLRSILGLPKHGTPYDVIRSEFGRYPLRTFWWKQVLTYRSRLMDLPRERLLSRAFEVNEWIIQKSWSSHVDRWLDARAARHAQITGHSPDKLYSTQVDAAKLTLRYKVEHQFDMKTHTGTKTATYMRFKRDDYFEDYLSSMANSQLRKSLSRFRCGSHWLRCCTRFMSSDKNEQSCPACLEGRVGGEHETEHHFIFDCDAYDHIRRHQTFQPLFADLEAGSLYALYKKNDYLLIAKFLLRCRRERANIVRYNELDIRT